MNHGLKCLSLMLGLKNPGLKCQESKGLKSSWLKSLGLKLGVEKFWVEIFCNLDGATVAVGTFFLARFGFESVWFS